MIKVNIRLEKPEDYREVEVLTKKAFEIATPECDEHYLVHLLRKSNCFIPQLDFVAEADGRIVGNVIFSMAKLVDDNGSENSILTFGPLSVLPEAGNMGVGSALMKHSILEAKRLGYKGIAFHGHPDYYPRFGFQNAKVFGITSQEGTNYDALMAMELYEGALNGISGRFYEDEAFYSLEKDKVAEYSKGFPDRPDIPVVPLSYLLDRLPEAAKKRLEEEKLPNLRYLTRTSGRELLMWEGIGRDELVLINNVLKECGLPQSLFPENKIFEKAKNGIRVLEI